MSVEVDLSIPVIARLPAYYGVRNCDELERLHVHHISDSEMRGLMLDVERGIEKELRLLVSSGALSLSPNCQWSSIDLYDWQSCLQGGTSYDRKVWRVGPGS